MENEPTDAFAAIRFQKKHFINEGVPAREFYTVTKADGDIANHMAVRGREPDTPEGTFTQ